MAVRVGRWDCASCGKIGNLGPHVKCAACGAPRPKKVVFYLPEDAEVVTDEQEIREARKGANWVCSYCTANNKASATHCHACGNERSEAGGDASLQEREYNLDNTPRQQPQKARPLHPDEAPKKAKSGRKGLFGGLGALVAAIVGLFSFPITVDVEVAGFAWERTLQMEHYEPVQKEDWSTPSGAYNVSSFQAIHHYDQVLRGYETRTRDVQVQTGTQRVHCGTRDKGNGYFEDVYCNEPIYETRTETYQEPIYDQVPVYKTKYKFTVMEWVGKPEYLLKASAADQQPQWPDNGKKSDPDKWREGKKTEKYTITVREKKGKTHEETLPLARWEQLKAGQKVKAKKVFLVGTWMGLKE